MFIDFAGKPGDYLVVEDVNQKSTWHLPYKKNGTPDRRLCGAAWAALHGGYRGNKYEGPQKQAAIAKLRRVYKSQGWDLPSEGKVAASNDQDGAEEDDTLVHLSEYELGPTIGGDRAFVLRRGKIFEAGDYPDKEFIITPEEVIDAVTGFEPVPIDSEHRPSVFDGKLGSLIHVDIEDDGRVMTGVIQIPRWLDDVLGPQPAKVSTTWDRDSKHLEGLALTVDPRVADAAMLSSFNRASEDGSNSSNGMPWDVQKGVKHMGLKEKFSAWWNGLTPEDMAEFEGADDPPEGDGKETPVATGAPVVPSPDPEIEALKKQVALFAAEKKQGEATQFVDDLIRAGKLLPASRQWAVLSITSSGNTGTVSFTKDGAEVSMSHEEVVKALLSSLQPHTLLTKTPITDLPKDSVVLGAGASSEKTPYEEGLEVGRKYVEQNYRNNGNK